jgi:hypothetical protein
MAGLEEKKSSWWVTAVVIVAFNITSGILGLWFVKPAASGIALFLIILAGYRFIPQAPVSFPKWAFSGLLLTAAIIGAFYGLPRLLCHRFGVAWTWGLIGTGFFLSIRWLSLLIHGTVEDSIWKWLAVSAGMGIIAALLAWSNPEGFCA